MPSDRQIIISTKTILTILLILIFGWLLFQVRSIVFLVFISLILALAFDPLVSWLKRHRVPRGFGVLMTYVLILVVFAVLSGIGFGSVVEQIKGLIFQLKDASGTLSKIPTVGPFLSNSLGVILREFTPKAGGSVFRFTLNAFSFALSVITVLVFTAYLLLDFDNVRRLFLGIFSRPQRVKAEMIMKEVEERLGFWLRSQFFLMLIVGGLTFFGLWLLNIDYALPLALIAGLLEVVPIIGPIISAIPGVLVGFSLSPVMGLGVLALYVLVQQLENHLIVPKVMQKTVGFNPLVTMLALMVGGKLFGVVGMLLAVPTTLAGYIVVKNLLEQNPKP